MNTKELRELIEDKYYKYANKYTSLPQFLILNEDNENLQEEYRIFKLGAVAGFDKYMGMFVTASKFQPKGTCHVYSLMD